MLVDADGRLRWRTTGPVSEHSGSELRAASPLTPPWMRVRLSRCRSSSSSSRSTPVPSVPRADRCHFRYGARDAHGGALVALRAGVRNPIGNVRDVCRTGLPLVQGHRTRGSFVDRGLTFGTTTQGGVCVLLRSRTGPHSRRPASPPRDHPHPRRARTVRRVVAPARRSRVNGHRRRVVVAARRATSVGGWSPISSRAAITCDAWPASRTSWTRNPGAEVEVVAGDVLDGIARSCVPRRNRRGVLPGPFDRLAADWQTRDRTAAENCRDRAADLEQIVYLGGLGGAGRLAASGEPSRSVASSLRVGCP